jgi:hypothetical protein
LEYKEAGKNNENWEKEKEGEDGDKKEEVK